MENVQSKPMKKLEVSQVEELLKNPDKVVIVQTAPSVRVSLGEMFGGKIGEKVTGKMVSALRRIGFRYVFDTDFGADITIWEEAQEFLERVKKGGPYPQFNSCCIGWLSFADRTFHDFFKDGLISSVKSPIGCLGSVAKTYFADRIGVSPENIVVVAVVPCILKKNENALPYNKTNDLYDVDYCWTTKDLGNLIAERGIDFNALEDGEFDNPLGESTGGGTIFGRSGGVLEAIIRNAIYFDRKTTLAEDVEFVPSPLSPDILDCHFRISGQEMLACRCGMVGARLIGNLVKEGKCPYHFVEVMACPGGCIMGAGQPMHLPAEGIPATEVRRLRTESLNAIDHSQEIRICALNSSVQKVYDAIYDGKPGSEKAEKALHRRYVHG